MSDERRTELQEVSLGQYGSTEITDTSEATPPTGYYFVAVEVVADAVVSAQTDYGVTNMDLTAFTLLPAGSVYFGKWTSLTLTSGEVVAYHASK